MATQHKTGSPPGPKKNERWTMSLPWSNDNNGKFIVDSSNLPESAAEGIRGHLKSQEHHIEEARQWQNASSNVKTFTLVNNCKETIWPGIITRGSDSNDQGFTLKPGQNAFYNATTAGWSGRIWARTDCNFDKNGTGKCQTGSCGTSLKCTGPSSPPNTIAEFTLSNDVDFYDISLVDGFNLPLVIAPINGKGNCSIAGCDGDLRQNCSSELAVKSDGKVVACRSACDVFNTDEYCCRGAFANPVACLPSNYSRSFKQICPAAASYAFDDRSSIITCSASEYIVTFCASR
ncbi:unnamed protein product [Dovyalis caffra]|uniref:Thaumatin-like protein n=1 Tax=Dovyalis caffra TaxID=77055 RepID=A0AAV1SSK3_9ROSI|nr:unnamed protein product [Dovyalis caffra]